MQLQGLMLMLLLMIIFPLMILTSSNEVFFIVIALVLIFSSLRNLHGLVFPADLQDDSAEDDTESDELEDFLGVDVKKLETGFHVIKNLIVLLFFTYCTFYIYNIWLKYFIFTIALYWIYDIILSVQNKRTFTEISLLKNIWFAFINISTLSIVLLAAFNKLIINNN